MIYLLLDSSNTFLSVGIKKGNRLIAKTSYQCFQRQSEYMIVEIDKIFKKNKLDIKKIDGVMVSIGPGSYTGIRIALTIAKVISFALSIPIYPISTLEINKIIGDNSIVLFNARSNRSYIAAFSKTKRILKDQVMNNEDVIKYINSHKKYRLVGDLAYLSLKGETIDILDNMNKLFNEIKPVKDANKVKPIYLKESYLWFV